MSTVDMTELLDGDSSDGGGDGDDEEGGEDGEDEHE